MAKRLVFFEDNGDVGSIENRKPRILVIEDDVFIAMDVEYMVGECGCVPVGPVSNVEAGLLAVRQNDLDGAVLDVNLGGERVWPVADLLHEHGVPFVLATGYSMVEVPERFKECQVLHKPLTEGALFAALDALGLMRR
ncbi:MULTISPECIES: response regulator [unclassified Mesorhizobium]|uniref:response regulator n=1 Tax=unclassified Mesorhizobium TaxID=325217 RepID=UPI001CCDF562|nr:MULTISPECIES: response regulator [unclassified Mesorhizobium]MBZ9823196.1 response regulator [Mesorhizobium sp. CA4]